MCLICKNATVNFDLFTNRVYFFSFFSLFVYVFETLKNIILFLTKPPYPTHKYLVEVQIARTSYQDKFNVGLIFVNLSATIAAAGFIKIYKTNSFEWFKLVCNSDEKFLHRQLGIEKRLSVQFRRLVKWLLILNQVLISLFISFAVILVARGLIFALTENWQIHQSFVYLLLPLITALFSMLSFYAGIHVVISNNVLFILSIIYFIFKLKSMTKSFLKLSLLTKQVQMKSHARLKLDDAIKHLKQFAQEVKHAQTFVTYCMSSFFVAVLIVNTTFPYLMIFEEQDMIYNLIQSLLYVNVLLWNTWIFCFLSTYFYRQVRFQTKLN